MKLFNTVIATSFAAIVLTSAAFAQAPASTMSTMKPAPKMAAKKMAPKKMMAKKTMMKKMAPKKMAKKTMMKKMAAPKKTM